jgi:predicted transcriptional regulator of viral defense system
MTGAEVLAEARALGQPVVATRDVAARIRRSSSSTSHALGRLGQAGLVRSLGHGLWSLEPEVDPYRLPDHLTRPYPSYVSLHTALYHRGLVGQIPRVIYVVSLDRAREIDTRLGRYSIHHVTPELFGGFIEWEGVKMATAEKALFDALYLAPARGGRFSGLPEVELPARFSEREVRRWIARVRSPQRRALIERRLGAILAAR